MSRRSSLFTAAFLLTTLPILLPPNLPAQEAVGGDTGDSGSVWVEGPQKVQLGDIASLDLSAGLSFADAQNTRILLEQAGNPTQGNEMGLVTPVDESAQWFIVFEWADVGYVKDDDQGKIDAAGLLKQIREATEASNEERKKMGGGELHVLDWVIPPYYDAKSHNLVWALEAADEKGDKVVNYNLRMLGRKGYMSATLVTDPALLEAHKGQIDSVLAGYDFNQGGGYADFVSGDKLAGYGLTALVAGGAGAAAAKLGLFAVLAKFLGKAWKMVVAGLIGLGALLKRLFGFGRKSEEDILPPPPPPPLPNNGTFT